MTRIDSNQQLIQLVRQQLSRVSRAKVARSAKLKNTTSRSPTTGISTTQQLSESGDFTEEEMQRALVHGILVEEFGESLINEAQFQQIVDRITRQLQQDEDSAALTKAALGDFAKPD